MKRLICFVLCTFILAGALISCANNEPEDTDATDTTAVTTEMDKSNICEVPDTDEWQGKEFRVWENSISKTDVFSEEITGDSLNDAVYRRNKMVEDKYGVKIVLTGGEGSILPIVASGTDAFDLFGQKYAGMNQCILNGVCISIESMTYMAPEKAWWDTALIDSFKIGGKQFVFSGDFSQRIMDYTWTILVNQEMAADNDLEDVYETVQNGKWTIERLKQNCTNVSYDSSGDSTLDHNDTWGFVSSKNVATALMTAAGLKTVVRNSNDAYEFNLTSDRSIDILEKIWAFSMDSSFQIKAQSINTGVNVYTEAKNIFTTGRALYRACVIKDAITTKKNTFEFAFLPLPKLDENQEDYVSTFQAHSAGTYIVPKTISDVDFVSAILEYMCYCSTDTVNTTYYDVVLKTRTVSVNETESIEMLDLIFENATTDIGLHLGIASMRTFVDNMLNSESNTISSDVASKKDEVATEIFKYENSVKIMN